MSTKTKTPSTPKPGSLKAAHVRIDELEKKAASTLPHKCKASVLEARPVARQYTGRVSMPSYGIPLPAGIGFHGYVSTRLEDALIGDAVLPPSEDDVLAILRLKADAEFPGHVDVVVSDISVLPEGWNEAATEEE